MKRAALEVSVVGAGGFEFHPLDLRADEPFDPAPDIQAGHWRTTRGAPQTATNASPRRFAGLPELTYPFHDHEVVPSSSGVIGLHGRAIFISSVLGGQRLGLREVDTDVRLVSFMPCDLGYIDLEACTLQPIDTPFGSRVSPM